MYIKNHKLYNNDGTQVSFVKSPNFRTGLTAKYLIVHYTGGGSYENVIERFENKSSKVSAHFVIGRDGRVTQMVPLNLVSWHAGTSEYKGIVGLNGHSIGIELVNWGPLTQNQAGQWISWTGKVVPNNEVVVARHKNGGAKRGWQTYTEAQMDTLEEVSKALIKHHGLVDVIGHEDIAPSRKTDPGPAFQMEAFRSMLFGRKDEL
jgi:N-acetylmuramoyl-L-alanine amidase